VNDNIYNAEKIDDNLDYLKRRHGEIYEAYQKFGQLVHEEGGPLGEKTRWLIKVALSAAAGNSYSLRTHILKAVNSGCTNDEIEHSLLLVAPTAGFPKMMEALMVLRSIIEETEE
jgi:alkylhydroperoxidase/carboxymuconolactone decarboxylase family protein YurZ